MELKIYKAFFSILVISAIAVTALIAIKYGRNKQYENENQDVVEAFSQELIERE